MFNETQFPIIQLYDVDKVSKDTFENMYPSAIHFLDVIGEHSDKALYLAYLLGDGLVVLHIWSYDDDIPVYSSYDSSYFPKVNFDRIKIVWKI